MINTYGIKFDYLLTDNLAFTVGYKSKTVTLTYSGTDYDIKTDGMTVGINYTFN